MRALILFLATGAYFGLGPVAPGTWGTLPAIALFYWMSDWSGWAYAPAVVAVAGLGVWVCERAAPLMHSEDPKIVVIDEIAGYLVAVAFLPFSWKAALVAFAWFRLLDAWKPWVIGRLDRTLRGGVGVMADDLAAGLLAAVLTRLTLWAW